MGLILFWSTLWILCILGLGMLLKTLVCGSDNTESGLTDVGFGGLSLLAFVGTGLHFLTPLTPAASTCMAFAGFVLFVFNFEKIKMGLTRKDCLALAAILLCIAFAVSSRKNFDFDTGAYRLQAIRWNTESPIVYGLANLEGALGYNSSWFVISSMLELPFLQGKSSFLLNPIFVFFFAAGIYFAWKKILRGRAALPDLFLGLAVFPLISEALATENLASASYDLPVTFLSIYIIYLVLKNSWKPAFYLSSFAVTVKLSGIVLLGGTLFSAMRRTGIKQTVLFAAFLLTFFWIMRGVFLSGCLIFPLQFTRLPGLYWASPETSLQNAQEIIRYWARLALKLDETRAGYYFDILSREKILNTWEWLQPWFFFHMQETSMKFLLSLGALGGLLLLKGSKNCGRSSEKDKELLPPFLISISGTVFWFFTAPDPRFGYGFLFSLVILIIILGLRRCGMENIFSKNRRLVLTLLFTLCFAGLIGRPSLHWPEFPTPALRQWETEDGTRINVSAEGVQCWNSPLPCSAIPKPGLKAKPGKKGLPEAFFY